MAKVLITLLMTVAIAGTAVAQTCESRAVGRDGRPLAGAARTSFIAACKRDACTAKAVGRDGKPLRGAAKANFMAKCERPA